MKSEERLLEEAENALKNIFTAIDNGWWSMDHDQGCPEDDTCECNAGGTAKIASDVLNDISYRMRFAKGKRVVERGMNGHTAHEVRKLDGEQVVTTCGQSFHHEALYVDDLKKIPGHHECFPEEQTDYLPPGTHLAIHGPVHRDGTRTKFIGCMDTGKGDWTLRAATKSADEGDPGATVEIIERKDCPNHDEDESDA